MQTIVRDTSLRSYRNDALPNLGERQQVVYHILEGVYNMTNSEIARQLDWSINKVTPRVFELREKGLVFEDEKRTCNVTGRTAYAWAVKRERTLFP